MKKFDKYIYEKFRERAKLILTGHLGKVVEEDDKLICYVKQSKCRKRDFNNSISCKGANYNKEIADAYHLNKKICYVFDNIKFMDIIFYLHGYCDCEIIIRNCTINLPYSFGISVDGKLTIEDTNFIGFYSVNIGATELNVNNVNIDGLLTTKDSEVVFSSRENINITNCNIGKTNSNPTDYFDELYGNVNKIELIANNDIEIKNSKFNGESRVECISKSGTINVDEQSLLISKNEVLVEGNNFESINISSPKVILNGNNIKSEDDNIQLNNDNSKLILKRIELIDALRKVKNKIENANFEKIEKHYNNLNNKPIGRVLKK